MVRGYTTYDQQSLISRKKQEILEDNKTIDKKNSYFLAYDYSVTTPE